MPEPKPTLWSRARRALGLAPPPGAADPGYVYQPEVAAISFEEGVAILERRGYRVVPYGVDNYSPEVVARTRAGLDSLGIPVEELRIDPAEFAAYREAAEYTRRFPDYYGTRMAEKQLEHFVTLRLLAPRAPGVFLDVASEHSPVPEIYERLSGAPAYGQDIQYAPGVEGRRIGGDACAMPVPAGFADTVALTCSIEHFEGDADVRLCRELGRVVGPGGRFVIAPLYLNPEAVAVTDPVYSAQAEVPFDDGVALHCARDWRNRHGRFYSPETLKRRLVDALEPAFDVKVVQVTGWESIPEHTYLRFALFGRRRAT